MSTVTTEDLRGIKGLGPRKAEIIRQTLESNEAVTAKDLAEIQGVSDRLAKEVVRLVKGDSAKTTAKATKTTASKATAKATRKKATRKKASNGSKYTPGNKFVEQTEAIQLTAGFVRKAARQMIEEGRLNEAKQWLSAVMDLMDDENVPHDRLSN